MRGLLALQVLDPEPGSPEALRARIAGDILKWRALAEQVRSRAK